MVRQRLTRLSEKVEGGGVPLGSNQGRLGLEQMRLV
jgi:hypothetical protein